jgi:hypothetical protein
MSINDQVAGLGACRVFAMREDTIDPKSQQGLISPKKRVSEIVAQIFLLLFQKFREQREEQP